MAEAERKLPQALLFGLVGGVVVQGVVYYPELHELVAYHFDGMGRPDAWCGKATLVAGNSLIAAALSFVFFGLSRLLPRVPPDLIKMPGKTQWSIPERRQVLVDLLIAMVLWIGIATEIFLVLMFQKIYAYNTLPKTEFGGVVIPFAVLVALIVIVVVYFNMRFRRVP